MQKGRMKGNAKRGATIAFGSYGLKALEQHWITDRQIEAARQALTREMKREGMVWIRIFPDKPITRKPPEVRMGKGKGNLEFWAAVVKPGRILFEVDGVTEAVAKASLHWQQVSYRSKQNSLHAETWLIYKRIKTAYNVKEIRFCKECSRT